MLKKLFILDDDPDLLELLQTILRKQFEVFVFSDPVQLFLRLSYCDADIILMDHIVGNHRSPAILQELNFLQRKQGLKKIPVVLHSGHVEIEQISLSVAADGFIRKPSNISEIRRYLVDLVTASGYASA